MKPYFQSKHTTLYHGDCLEIMPELAAGSVDLVLTDPPYGINYATSWRSRSHELSVKIRNDETLDCFGLSLPDIFRILKDDRHYYIFASPRKISQVQTMLNPYNWKSIIAWDKGDRGTVGDLVAGFGEAWEAIFYGMKGRRALNGKRPRTVIRYDWSSTIDPVHPTVKPVSLLCNLVSMSTHVRELVFDPFAGSGTTAAACVSTNHQFIGIEMEEKYCAIAASRIERAEIDAAQNLFLEPEPAQEYKQMELVS